MIDMTRMHNGFKACPLFCVVIALAAMTFDSTARAATGEQNVNQRLEQMQRQLDRAEARLAAQDAELTRLRNEVDADWMSGRRSEQVKTLVHEVLADARTRSSLLDAPVSAGHNGSNFFLASEDGTFLLKLLGQLQVRYVFSTSDNAYDIAASEDLDDDRGGFEVTRVRFGFTGHVIDPSWQYMIWTGHNFNGGSLLLDAWVRKTFDGGLSIQAGQFKVPFLHEWLVSETRQQFVERSLVHGYYSGSYTQGVTFDYRGDTLHGLVSLNDGLGGTNRQWHMEDVEAVAVTARGEVLLAGDWSQYADFQAWRDKDTLLVVGAAGHVQSGEYGTSGSTLTTGDEALIVQWTADVQLEHAGIGLYAAVVGRHLSDADNVPDLEQYAFVIQGSYFITDQWEAMARYEWGDLDLAGIDDLSIFTVGFTRYFAGHQVKLTTDVGYAFNSLQTASVSGNTFGWPDAFFGWRPDADDAEGQIVVRSQLQLLF